MAQEPTQDHQAFTQIVKDSLLKAQERISGLRKTNTGLVIISILSSAATTLVAGGTAAVGPVMGTGDVGWRLACILAALFAFVSTVTTALIQQLKTSERLIEDTQYVSRLKALQVAIVTGSQSWEEIAKEYAEIVKTYPELNA